MRIPVNAERLPNCRETGMDEADQILEEYGFTNFDVQVGENVKSVPIHLRQMWT